jgi:hypothetical protein
MRTTPTNTLLRSVGYPDAAGETTPIEPTESSELYALARRNKIASLYVRVLHDEGHLTTLMDEWEDRRGFQERQARTLERAVENIPANAEYALVKSSHDVWVDSKDLDFIVYHPSLDALEEVFLSEGYEFCGRSPSSFDVLDPETDIQLDVQDSFSLQRVVYFDRETIRGRIEERERGGVTVPCVSRPDDLAIIVIHSITEQLFLLKELYAAIVALQQFSDREFGTFIDIVDENHISAACSAFFTVVRELCQESFGEEPPYLEEILSRYGESEAERSALRSGDFETPHRYTGRTGIRTVADKLRSPSFSRSLLGQVPRMLSPPTAFHILSQIVLRRTRKDYVHDTSEKNEDIPD